MDAAKRVEIMKETTLEAWEEWKEKCAIALCSEATKQILSDWAVPQIRNRFREKNPTHELAKATEAPATGVDPRWSLMEVHFVAGKQSAGKTYKDHLFDCIKSEQSAEANRTDLQRYFSRACANEIPKLAKKELAEEIRALHEGVQLMSLDQPVDAATEGPSLAEAYQGAQHEGLDPASDSAKAELQAIARQEAEAWLGSMTLREKLVWGCEAAGRTLADPAIESIAGVKRSQLYQLRKEAKTLHEFRAALLKKWHAKHEETPAELAVQAAAELLRLCEKLLPPEKSAGGDLSSEGK